MHFVHEIRLWRMKCAAAHRGTIALIGVSVNNKKGRRFMLVLIRMFNTAFVGVDVLGDPQ